MRLISILAVLLSGFWLSACGGSAAGDPASAASRPSETPSATATRTQITGKITYDRVLHAEDGSLDYTQIKQQPARGVIVEALSATGEVIGSAITNLDGSYELEVDVNTDIRLQAKAQMLSSEKPRWNFRVTDNTQDNALYVMQGGLVNTGQNAQQIRDLHAPLGWTGNGYTEPRVSAPFAILDSVYLAATTFSSIDSEIEFPLLEMRWSPNNRTLIGQRALGQIGTSAYLPDVGEGGAIYLLGEENRDTDEFDPHVILHEWAHYFEHQISRADSVGGLHSLQDRLDARVAFSEGWSNAFAAIITGDPIYKDSSGTEQSKGFSFDLRNSNVQNPGWYNEASVGSALYDIMRDQSVEGEDTATSLSPIYEVMQSDSFVKGSVFATIFSLADGLRTALPQQASQINQRLEAYAITGRGVYGDGERNAGAIRSSLPVYKEVRVNGGTVQLCSVDDAGIFNKLGNREFIFMELQVEQDLTMTLRKISGDDDRDPDFNIWRGTDLVHKSASSKLGEEIFSGRLASGSYVIEAFDFYNINGAGPRRGDGCYGLSVTG